ncbi:MAG: GspE/PulE family protein [Actinomycetota bacterium]|nr:GspE/PulE family protein [Actinomycetota bacterium]
MELVPPSPTKKFGELLLDRDLISENQLSEALLQQTASGKRLGTLLVELGALDERTVTFLLAAQFGIEVVDLRKVLPQPDALALVPEAIARALNAIPLRIVDSKLEIAVADPADQKIVDDLTSAAGRQLILAIASPTDIRRTIDNSYRALAGIESHVEAFVKEDSARKAVAPQLQDVSETAPVVKVVNLMITQGLRDRASDIHIEPQEGRMRIRYRIDGALHDVLALPDSMSAALVSRIKIMASMNIVERQRPQDGQIELNIDGRPLDIRVSTTPTIWGEKAVLRLLDKSKPLFHLEELGMPEDVQSVYKGLVSAPYGMMICAGPTGAGKTTTLYATLSEINSAERNVMTIEDPVEYVFPSINQIQIREQAGVTFAGGLKSILRQDPDVILVGEIRDVETARIAVQSALTGHFVLSSIHATDSVSALLRFLDMGIEAFLVASAMTGIVGQRLMRRICSHCKAPHNPTPDELAFFTESGGKANTKFMHGKGCNFCSQTGYQERIGVYEMLQITQEVKQLIVRHATHEKIMQIALKQGMKPMRGQAITLVEQGVTTVSEVLRSIYML